MVSAELSELQVQVCSYMLMIHPMLQASGGLEQPVLAHVYHGQLEAQD